MTMADSATPTPIDGAGLSPAEATNEARRLWLSATCQSDLDEVERLYRWALSEHDDGDENDGKSKSGDKDDVLPPKKKIIPGHCGLDQSQFNQAGEKLALLLCQSGRCKKAKKGLTSMGFTCRLSKQVLDYPCEEVLDNNSPGNNVFVEITDKDNNEKKEKKKKPSLCQIVDGFLSQLELERLRLVFESPTASYWTDHNYAVEPPSPYFSYVMPLEDIISSSEEENANREFGFLGGLVKKIKSCPLLNEKFPKLRGNAKYVEFWAHNRPHASGHQMHFDSDDEGRGGIRNPIISTILYITAEEDDTTTNNNGHDKSTTGGPSLVTNQKLTDIRIATKGWMAHPKPQRLVAFDGRYLHGVVPGKGFQKGRRVTLMMAFWEDIQVRGGVGPGSARPFPSNNLSEWARHLVAPVSEEHDCSNDYGSCIETDPIKLDVIYETLDGKPWKRGRGMPSYDQVFQGF